MCESFTQRIADAEEVGAEMAELLSEIRAEAEVLACAFLPNS